jgi:hypothetical protein
MIIIQIDRTDKINRIIRYINKQNFIGFEGKLHNVVHSQNNNSISTGTFDIWRNYAATALQDEDNFHLQTSIVMSSAGGQT